MKKPTITGLLLVWGMLSFAQGIYNNGARIVSTTGSYWVVDNGSFTLTSTSSTNLAQMANLTITGDASLTIASTSFLTVSGTLLNSSGTDGLVLQSDASGSASLIQSSASVNATQQRYIAGWSDNHGWHFLSSPVASQAISPEFVDVTANPMSALVDFYRWSEPLDLWVNIKNLSSTYNQGSGEVYFSNEVSPAFVNGKGYLVAYQSLVTKNFSGTLNYESVSVTGLSKTEATGYSGWNLIGNPFPSAIQWGLETWSMTNVDDNCQIWNENNAGYTVVSSGNNIIPAMNGFMVHASVNGASLTIPTAARVHDITSWYKGAQVYENGIVLKAIDPEGSTAQESVIRFDANASEGYDTKYDSYFLSGYAPRFYSRSLDENYALNTLPTLTEERQIPLSFVKNGSTNFFIQAEGMETLNPPYPLYLTDLKTNTTQNLTNNPIYTFTAEEGDDPNRFLLHFQAVGIDEPTTSGQTLPIVVWNHENTLTVSNPEQLPGEIMVYNITGQTALMANLENVTKQTIPHQLIEGIYVVQVSVKGKVKNQKILVR